MLSSKDIKDIINAEIIGFDAFKLEEDQNFTDAGIDSLDHMSILLIIQEKLGIKFPDEVIDQCDSIAGILSSIEKSEKV